jgi:hypothetical protein
MGISGTVVYEELGPLMDILRKSSAVETGTKRVLPLEISNASSLLEAFKKKKEQADN